MLKPGDILPSKGNIVFKEMDVVHGFWRVAGPCIFVISVFPHPNPDLYDFLAAYVMTRSKFGWIIVRNEDRRYEKFCGFK